MHSAFLKNMMTIMDEHGIDAVLDAKLQIDTTMDVVVDVVHLRE